jgi:hypothetical protein
MTTDKCARRLALLHKLPENRQPDFRHSLDCSAESVASLTPLLRARLPMA